MLDIITKNLRSVRNIAKGVAVIATALVDSRQALQSRISTL
jgi:hypothetical protein